MKIEYRPLVYMWIAHYEEEVLPQFDPETGIENKFSAVDLKRITKFGFYPFSEKMARKIWEASQLVVISTDNPVYEVLLKPHHELFFRRTNLIVEYTYRVCRCGYEFRWGKSRAPDNVGIPRSGLSYVENIDGKDYAFPKCPRCGYFDGNIAKAEIQIQQKGGRKRETLYKLGVNGGQVLTVNEEGQIV